MGILENFKGKSLLIIGLLLFPTGTPGCVQNRPQRLVAGPSNRVLVPSTPHSDLDGISRIILSQVFKAGSAEYSEVGSGALKNAPPLPTGYVLFKDRVYQVKTDAIVSGFNIVVFNLPSVENESEFKKLAILHLEWDEMSAWGKSWNEVTLFPEWADERLFHFISKDEVYSLQPDFKSRRIAGLTFQFGIFAIALAPEPQPESTAPFTQIEVTPSSSPEPVRVGDKVTHTIAIENKGPKAAAEVNLKEELNTDFEYISASSDLGSCKQSNASTGRVVCHIGALPAGARATIKVVARVLDNPLTKAGSEMRNDLEVNFKENVTDYVQAPNQLFKDFKTTIVRER